ncbi:hypothetical protein FHG87_018405 [Trinorchestia longiramus]|nr:hypothetical protein FHG87_018405 [Trinorchestia longiramus]
MAAPQSQRKYEATLKLVNKVYDQIPAFTDVFDEETFYIFAFFFTVATILGAVVASSWGFVETSDIHRGFMGPLTSTGGSWGPLIHRGFVGASHPQGVRGGLSSTGVQFRNTWYRFCASVTKYLVKFTQLLTAKLLHCGRRMECDWGNELRSLLVFTCYRTSMPSKKRLLFSTDDVTLSQCFSSGPYRPPEGVEEMQGGGRRVRLEGGAYITV